MKILFAKYCGIMVRFRALPSPAWLSAPGRREWASSLSSPSPPWWPPCRAPGRRPLSRRRSADLLSWGRPVFGRNSFQFPPSVLEKNKVNIFRKYERLDQGHLHLNQRSRDRHVSAGNRTKAFMVGGELFEQHINNFLEQMRQPHGYSQCMWLHEHTWSHLSCTTVGCRPNSICKSFNPEYWHQALARLHIHCQARQIMSWSPL